MSTPFKMKGFSGFGEGTSPVKHAKSAGRQSEIYGKHTNEDHPNYWKKNGNLGSKEYESDPVGFWEKKMFGDK